MKVVEIIKTKNGLNFLGANLTELTISSRYKPALEVEMLNYDKKIVYEEKEFSFKEYARTLRKKVDVSFSEVISAIYNNSNGEIYEMARFLNGYIYNFDGDYLKFEKENLTYMPYNKVQEITNGLYEEKGRREITIYKFLAKVFKGTAFREQYVKEFAELIMVKTNLTLRVEFLKGDDIGNSYHDVSHQGWSRSSCMANKTNYPPSMFAFYGENCELGVVMNGDEVVGRFLRWLCEDGVHYEDSLYYKDYLVRSWYLNRIASEKIRNCTNALSREDNKKVVVRLKRKFTDYKNTEKPSYMDSLSWVSDDKMFISREKIVK